MWLSRFSSNEYVDLRPVLMALRHNDFFTGISLLNLPRKDVILTLADVIRYNTKIEYVYYSIRERERERERERDTIQYNTIQYNTIQYNTSE
jgi:hypothetical protein